ncbi:5'-3' exonuclease PLD3-like [Rhincodon typus]|uniref:5'-3' exonuclease PLD3-like n=1 Tax=Rhincodon typus TaxID=259920 RepID=UPI00202F2368|nr:5'-3' exonuclease PLD3-like [Rhincodon typus]
MPRKVQEHRRRSKRLKEQVPEQGEMEAEGQEEVDSQSRGMLILTPRNPIRGSSRLLRSSATAGLEEQAEPVNLKPLQVILQKVKADIDLKRKKKKKKKKEEEEEEDEEETKEEGENGAQQQDTPRSITPPLLVKYQEGLRPAMSSLQKLRAKIPEEPRRRTIWRDLPKIPTVRKTPMVILYCSLSLPSHLHPHRAKTHCPQTPHQTLPGVGQHGISLLGPKYGSECKTQAGCESDCARLCLLQSSPPSLCASRRTSDLNAILSVIDDAKAFVSISVMELVPTCQYCEPPRFWSAIDDRLRKAACERHVSVRLLISCWEHSYRPMFVYLKSLNVLAERPLHCDIEVRIFKVPATEQQKKIPYGRVNHNKYMVTDRIAYIGTSNWSEDYFVRTAGVGLIINQTEVAHNNTGTLQSQLKAVFERDWNSNHALRLDSEEMKQQCLWHREGA